MRVFTVRRGVGVVVKGGSKNYTNKKSRLKASPQKAEDESRCPKKKSPEISLVSIPTAMSFPNHKIQLDKHHKHHKRI